MMCVPGVYDGIVITCKHLSLLRFNNYINEPMVGSYNYYHCGFHAQ